MQTVPGTHYGESRERKALPEQKTSSCPTHGGPTTSQPIVRYASALSPGSRVKATGTSSERHPMFLVLGPGTLTPLFPTPPLSEANETGRFRNCSTNAHTSYTPYTPTHANPPHIHKHVYPYTCTHTSTHTPQRNLCSAQIEPYTRYLTEGFGGSSQVWAGLGAPGEEGAFLSFVQRPGLYLPGSGCGLPSTAEQSPHIQISLNC